VKILWLINPGVANYASGNNAEHRILTCPLASARLRIGIAAVEWRRTGGENVFLDPEDARAVGSADFGAAKICFVSKFLADSPLQAWSSACAAARNSGSRLVVDITDHPFYERTPSEVTFYDYALKNCDALTVNSERMAELIAPHAICRPTVIEDAIVNPPGDPAFAPHERLRLLWFGHPRNLHYLQGCLDALASFAKQRRCRLTIVTEDAHGAKQLAREIQSRCGPALDARFIQWSLEATRKALDECDLVLIPSDPSSLIKAGASSNRLAEALNSGRFPVASPLSSYLPFSECAWLGSDMIEGIRWALANRDDVLARIRRGQARVAEKLSEKTIGRQWRALFESLGSFP
jgi:hypothetical protein